VNGSGIRFVLSDDDLPGDLFFQLPLQSRVDVLSNYAVVSRQTRSFDESGK